MTMTIEQALARNAGFDANGDLINGIKPDRLTMRERRNDAGGIIREWVGGSPKEWMAPFMPSYVLRQDRIVKDFDGSDIRGIQMVPGGTNAPQQSAPFAGIFKR